MDQKGPEAAAVDKLGKLIDFVRNLFGVDYIGSAGPARPPEKNREILDTAPRKN